ncbi:MAG: pyridoxal kinase PdxY [Proteobacteria bacterium]|nr:pyridoxal kinase PdxY [Pseudomonadota bacterium]
MNVLSIQSSVAYGHVGNSAATFALQRLGVNVWPVHTVQLAHHTAYGRARGMAFPAEHVAEVVRGVGERGAFAACDAVLSGYLGEPGVGRAVLEAVANVRRANPRAIYLCDPVMGDRGRGLYVRPEVAAFFRDQALGAADVLIPNHFELELLSGSPVGTLEEALAAARTVMARGPGTVVVTSLERAGAEPGTVEALAVERGAAWLVATPRLEGVAGGAGDAFAALFLAHRLKGADPEGALGAAASALFALLAAAARAGARELPMVAAQAEMADPPRRFAARRVE